MATSDMEMSETNVRTAWEAEKKVPLWIRDHVLERDLKRFCEIAKVNIFDPPLRLKLYMSGPQEIYDWSMNLCASLGLLGALIFTSTFSVMFNMDVSTFAASDVTYSRSLAQTVLVMLTIGVMCSALSVAGCIIYITQAPMFARKEISDLLVLLKRYYPFVMVAILFVCASITGSLIAVILWFFIAYTSNLAIILTVVFGVMLAAFYAFFFANIINMNRIVLAFEKHIAKNDPAKAFEVFHHKEHPTCAEATMLIQRGTK